MTGQGNIKVKLSSDQEYGLQYIMKQRLRNIMEVPTKDQIYDNVSFKLGAFYKRFWDNNVSFLKKNTRKAGQIIALSENMQKVSRQDDRLLKICAYARQINKFEPDNYRDWKNHIWLDLDPDQKKMMEEYVEHLTPPTPFPGESKEKYLQRSKSHMFSVYKRMKRAMLLMEVFEKIWTIRKYRSNNCTDDVKRHIDLTTQILTEIKKQHPHFRGYLSTNMGYEEWQQIEQLW